jgi:hypothetical protein
VKTAMKKSTAIGTFQKCFVFKNTVVIPVEICLLWLVMYNWKCVLNLMSFMNIICHAHEIVNR